MADLLDDDEMARWVLWKRATDQVWQAVVAEIAAATGLSAPDFAVLTRVVEDGAGRLRQQRLSDDLGWERSRLSRHLERMAERGLVRREGTVAERLVTATPHGRAVIRRARVAHARAVRAHLLDRVAGTGRFWTTVGELTD